MPYLKAELLLPPELILEIQKYVQGSLVYIPRPCQHRLGWGLKNGTRDNLDRRNQAIRTARSLGKAIDDIADEFALSPDSIRKIIYSKRIDLEDCEQPEFASLT